MPINITNGTAGAIKRAWLAYIIKRGATPYLAHGEYVELIAGGVDGRIEDLLVNGSICLADRIQLQTDLTGDGGDQESAQLGVTIKDETQWDIASGDDINTAELGKVVIDKKSSLKINMANVTVANIAAMEALDKENVDIVLMSITEDASENIIAGFYNLIYNYTESIGGGKVPVIPLEFEKDVTAAGSFRKLAVAEDA